MGTRVTGIAVFKKQLAPFLECNPHASVVKKKASKLSYVTKPWNDDSVNLLLKPAYAKDLVSALNNLILPPRFTAIYHSDKNTMEYIYAVLDENDPCFDREFDYTFDGKTYSCIFAKASDRLLILAKSFRRNKAGWSAYRNLLELREYVEEVDKGMSYIEASSIRVEPISFYVSGFKQFDEAEITLVSKHINFLVQYYDRESPYTIINPAETETLEQPKQLQFIEMTFPKKIASRQYDPFLLDLALEAFRVGPRLQFIYCYQILEYAAFYFLDDEVRRKLLTIISTPDIHSDSDRHISRILEALSGSIRQEYEVNIQKVVKVTCSAEVVWKELQQNLAYFTKVQNFDGGFVLEPLVAEDTSLETFCTMWHPKTADNLRFIRNALVHGREKRFGTVISPTPRNDLLIKPWANLIRRMAEQVIIYGRVA